jgi:trans-aconitate 2-methyltransferase
VSIGEKDWNPETYARFRGLRLRPALDLLANVGDLPEGCVIDLGCGDGAAAGALAARFAGHRLIGVDRSPAMLDRARGYGDLVQSDIATWQPDAAPALIFSNAALHWLPDHARLLPRLAAMLAPGGVLAVQMPRQFMAPSHRFLRDIAAAMFPDRFEFAHYVPPVAPAVDYHAMLQPLGAVDAWETDYIQRLATTVGQHPVQAFTASTAMRPILEKLTEAETAAFVAAYDAALGAAYPLHADGSVLFPFRRVFFTLKV